MKTGVIQVGDKSYINAKVVMLASEKESKKGQIVTYDGGHHAVVQKDGVIPNGITKFNELYFLSEEIKEKDHCLDIVTKLIFQYDSSIQGKMKSEYWKKIIATTDESLMSEPFNPTWGISPDDYKKKYTLPRPSNEFLQRFCKENGKIDEVLIELIKSEFDGLEVYKLKVSPDNTITIKKVDEKMYKAEEMFLNMQYYMEHCQREGYTTPQNWIENHKHF